MVRERQTWGEAKLILQKQVEGAERGCESMQSFTNRLQEQHRNMEHRFQQVLQGTRGCWAPFSVHHIAVVSSSHPYTTVMLS